MRGGLGAFLGETSHRRLTWLGLALGVILVLTVLTVVSVRASESYAGVRLRRLGPGQRPLADPPPLDGGLPTLGDAQAIEASNEALNDVGDPFVLAVPGGVDGNPKPSYVAVLDYRLGRQRADRGVHRPGPLAARRRLATHPAFMGARGQATAVVDRSQRRVDDDLGARRSESAGRLDAVLQHRGGRLRARVHRGGRSPPARPAPSPTRQRLRWSASVPSAATSTPAS